MFWKIVFVTGYLLLQKTFSVTPIPHPLLRKTDFRKKNPLTKICFRNDFPTPHQQSGFRFPEI